MSEIRPMDSGFLVPVIDDEGAPFWEGTAAGELRIQACAACAHRRHPPRPMCPRCQSTDAVWPAVSGRGTIWSFVVAHPPVLPAFAELSPFNVIVVAIDEDPDVRLVGNLVASPDAPIDSVDYASIEIGTPVRVTMVEITEGMYLPRWVLDET